MTTIPSEELKRQILASSDKTRLKDKTLKSIELGGITEGDVIETGQELEKITKMKGWAFVEAYMLRRMNLIGNLYEVDKTKQEQQQNVARGYVDLMQYIDQTIKAKDAILERENANG